MVALVAALLVVAAAGVIAYLPGGGGSSGAQPASAAPRPDNPSSASPAVPTPSAAPAPAAPTSPSSRPTPRRTQPTRSPTPTASPTPTLSAEVVVPLVVGKLYEDAAAMIRAAGLQVNGGTAGRSVFMQSPPDGAVVARGSTVSIWTS